MRDYSTKDNLRSLMNSNNYLVFQWLRNSIIIIGFSTRTYYWHYGYNQGTPGLFLHGDGHDKML